MSKQVKTVKLIKAAGEQSYHEFIEINWSELRRLARCSIFDTVNLRDGRVMLVDDTGMIDGKPINPKATELYHNVCKPGTAYQIHGDVLIVNDADFEEA